MDISRISNKEKLNLCKKYFYGGFAFLPFLWAINVFWFLKYAFCVPSTPEQKGIKKYVIMSGIGSFICLVGIVTWYIVFINKRAEWGILGDQLSFYIPKGAP